MDVEPTEVEVVVVVVVVVEDLYTEDRRVVTLELIPPQSIDTEQQIVSFNPSTYLDIDTDAKTIFC